MIWDRVPHAAYVKLIKTCFGPTLEPYGFTTKNSRRGVYWKETGNGIYHFIAPERSNRLNGYKILIFASSSMIVDRWEEKFPDSLPLVNPLNGYLSSSEGVGSFAQYFFAANKDAFENCFNREVSAALNRYAIPYLESIRSFNDLANVLPHTGMRGAALLHAGIGEEGRKLLLTAISGLSKLPADKWGHRDSEIRFYREKLVEFVQM